MSLVKRCIAEFIGTFWLVFGGCGSAVLAAVYVTDGAKIGDTTKFPLGIGLLGVSLAFGLTVLTMAYVIGHISGCHLNPAVSFGLFAANRFSGSDLLPYIVAQCLGAIGAAGVLLFIALGNPNFQVDQAAAGALATNGFGPFSPGGYSLPACLVAEFILTFMFLLVILGSTDRRAPQGLAPIAIGLCLTLIHLISIPVTNTSVNPARSLGPAIFVPHALGQVWLFWVAPILGAIAAGWLYNAVFTETQDQRLAPDTADSSIP